MNRYGAEPVERRGEDDYLSVDASARLLRVSRSTVWRWIGRGTLRGVPAGPRRVLVRRSDLDALIRPVKAEDSREVDMARAQRPLTEQERQQMLDAIEAAVALQEGLLRTRGGRKFSPS